MARRKSSGDERVNALLSTAEMAASIAAIIGENPEGWTQRTLARDCEGNPCDAFDRREQPASMRALGWLHRFGASDRVSFEMAEEVALDAIESGGGAVVNPLTALGDWNDESGANRLSSRGLVQPSGD